MSELKQKVNNAINYLKLLEPKDEPYYLAYSGGKDSDCIKILAQLAGVKFEAVHNLTTADAPETVNYIKSQKDVRIDIAHDKEGKPVTMWNLIPKKLMPPTRLIRYCCAELKERGGRGRKVITGVRRDESRYRNKSADLVNIIGKPKTTQKEAEKQEIIYRINRQGGMLISDTNDNTRLFVEQCYRTRKVTINPIVDWTDNDVWEFLHFYGCEGNPLYQCGLSRVGCVGCPMATFKMRYNEFSKYPKFKQMYIFAFERMMKERERLGKQNTTFTNGLSVFRWWMGEDLNQLTLDDLEELEIIKGEMD